MVMDSERLSLWLIAVDLSSRLNLVLGIERAWRYGRRPSCKLQRAIKALVASTRRSHSSFTDEVAKVSKHFYRQPPTKAGLTGKKQLTAFNTDAPTSGREEKDAAAFRSRIESSASLQEHDVIEILDMTAPSEKDPLNVFHEPASDLKDTEAAAEGKVH